MDGFTVTLFPFLEEENGILMNYLSSGTFFLVEYCCCDTTVIQLFDIVEEIRAYDTIMNLFIKKSVKTCSIAFSFGCTHFSFRF